MLTFRYPLSSKQLIKSLVDSNAAVILTTSIRCETSSTSSATHSDIEARGDSGTGASHCAKADTISGGGVTNSADSATGTGSSHTAVYTYTLSVTGAPVLDDPLASSRFADESLFTQCVRCLLACAHQHDRRHETDSSNGDSAVDDAHDEDMTLDFDMMTVGHEHDATAFEQRNAPVAASQPSSAITGAHTACESAIELTELSSTSSTRVVDASAIGGAVSNGSESKADRNDAIPLVITAQSQVTLSSARAPMPARIMSQSSTLESSEDESGDELPAAAFISAVYEYRPLLALSWLHTRSYSVAFYASAVALLAIFFVPDLDPGKSLVSFVLSLTFVTFLIGAECSRIDSMLLARLMRTFDFWYLFISLVAYTVLQLYANAVEPICGIRSAADYRALIASVYAFFSVCSSSRPKKPITPARNYGKISARLFEFEQDVLFCHSNCSSYDVKTP